MLLLSDGTKLDILLFFLSFDDYKYIQLLVQEENRSSIFCSLRKNLYACLMRVCSITRSLTLSYA